MPLRSRYVSSPTCLFPAWTSTHAFFTRPKLPLPSKLTLPHHLPRLSLPNAKPTSTVCSIFNKVRCLLLFISLRSLLTYPISDIPTSLIGDLDHEIIKRARDVITDATMTDILNEDPNGPTVFRDAVRQQIVALCTRLRISLVIIDKLMALANALVPKLVK